MFQFVATHNHFCLGWSKKWGVSFFCLNSSADKRTGKSFEWKGMKYHECQSNSRWNCRLQKTLTFEIIWLFIYRTNTCIWIFENIPESSFRRRNSWLCAIVNAGIRRQHLVLFLDRKIRWGTWSLPIEIQAKTQWGGLDFPHLLCTAAVIIPELELFSVVFSQLYLDLWIVFWACESR